MKWDWLGALAFALASSRSRLTDAATRQLALDDRATPPESCSFHNYRGFSFGVRSISNQAFRTLLVAFQSCQMKRGAAVLGAVVHISLKLKGRELKWKPQEKRLTSNFFRHLWLLGHMKPGRRPDASLPIPYASSGGILHIKRDRRDQILLWPSHTPHIYRYICIIDDVVIPCAIARENFLVLPGFIHFAAAVDDVMSGLNAS